MKIKVVYTWASPY